MNNNIEIWKTIEINPIYEVSNLGNVRNTKTNYILKPRDHNNGYKYVDLYSKNKSKRQYVHRLVAMAFIPNPENKQVVNHKNFNKSDNRVDNLEWCTLSENTKHAFYNNRLGNFYEFTKGKKVLCVELNSIFNSPLEAAKKLGIKACGIYKCATKINKTSNGFHWLYVE